MRAKEELLSMLEVRQLAESPYGQHWATRPRDDLVGSRSEMVSGTNERTRAADTHHDQVHGLFGGGLQNAFAWHSEFHSVVTVTDG